MGGMAALAPWIRARVWRSDNWCAELVQMRQELATEPRSAMAAERIFDESAEFIARVTAPSA